VGGVTETWAYQAANTIEVTGDLTAKYWPNQLIKITQGTEKFFVIMAISLVGGNTRMTVSGGGVYTLTTAAITIHHVTMNAASAGLPSGFAEQGMAYAAYSPNVPVDADRVSFWDSVANFGRKTLTWANLKATLKTYFDDIYAAAAKGVTGGDSHDHAGGAGAQIDHGGLGGRADDDHAGYAWLTGRAVQRLVLNSGIIAGVVLDSALILDAVYSTTTSRQCINWRYSGQSGFPVRIASIFNADGVGMELGFFTSTSYATDGTEGVRINKDGYVGIGIEAPTSPLHVIDPTGVTSGAHYTASLTGFVIGYNANGSAITSTIARAVSSLPLYMGTTAKPSTLKIYNSGGVSIGNAYSTDPGDTNLYITGNCSAQSFTDRTDAFVGDALEAIRKIGADLEGKIDHATLPEFVQATRVMTDEKGVETEIRERNIGNMISVLTVGIQQLIQELEKRDTVIADLSTRLDKLEGTNTAISPQKVEA